MSLAETMKRSSRLRIFIAASMAALFISYLGIWIRLINDPVERTGADFIHFYSAGRIAQLYGPSHVYDLALQQEMEEEQVGFSLAREQILPYNHMPFLIPVLQAMVDENYIGSFYRWNALMIIVYLLGAAVIGLLLTQAGLQRQWVLIAQISGLLFLPYFFSLMNGQDTAFVFLGTAVWVYGLLSGRPLLAGLGLSMTTIRPHIALLLALPMFFHNQKIFLGFLLGSGVLALLSVSILGFQGTLEFIDILLLSAAGTGHGIKQAAMFNLIGLLMRIMPWLGEDGVRLVGWVIYGTAIIVLCILWAKHNSLQDWRIGLTATLAVFVAPHLHFHDLTLLLIPLFEMMRLSQTNDVLKTPIAVAAPLAVSILLLMSNISPSLQYTVPYLIMLALVSYPYWTKSRVDATTPHRS